MRRITLLVCKTMLLLGAAVPIRGTAQVAASASSYDVASVRPTASPTGRSLLDAVPGRLIMTNIALRRLLLIAYDVQDYQLAGEPSWTGSEDYDIQAKSDANPSVQQMEGPMLQLLLEDRFKLKSHRETRQLPVYELTATKEGPKLQPSKEGSCTPYAITSPPPPLAQNAPPPVYCGLRRIVDGTNLAFEGKGVTMAELATTLSRKYNSSLGRNIVDLTGLKGRFDFHLEWALESSQEPDGLSLFTALQEQLGLKLVAAKGPVEVLVIDHIERPSAN